MLNQKLSHNKLKERYKFIKVIESTSFQTKELGEERKKEHTKTDKKEGERSKKLMLKNKS